MTILAENQAILRTESNAVDGHEASHNNSESSFRSNRIQSLDGLRAIAFLSVFLFHLGRIPGYTRGPALIYSNLVDWGFLGVDLFFVISGFIITALLLDEKRRNEKINLKLFFQRRALRIWPLYYLTLATSITLTIAFAKQTFDFGMYWQVLQKAYLPLSFFLYVIPPQASDMITTLMGQTAFPLMYSISILWSVCAEEQFYLVFPWFVAFAKTKRALIVSILIAVALSECLRVAQNESILGPFYLNSLSRVTPLAVGALIAVAEHVPGRLFKKMVSRSGLLLCVSALITIYILSGPARTLSIKLVCAFPEYPLIAICLGALLISALHNSLVKRWLSANILQALGKYTYCMYLVHFPIMYCMHVYFWNTIHDAIIRQIVWGIVSFALTFAVAKLSWIFIEKPLAKLRSRLIC